MNSLRVILLLQYLTIVQKSLFILGSNDGFFNVYFNCCIIFASFTMALINNIAPGKFGNNYYMCTGQDPAEYEFLGKKVHILKSSLNFIDIATHLYQGLSYNLSFKVNFLKECLTTALIKLQAFI